MTRFPGRRTVPLLALAALCLLRPPARADVLDLELLQRGPALMKKIRQLQYKNVGVLKFEVLRGGARESMEVGRLNSRMATRLENVLILANDNDERPIGIARAPGDVAACRDPRATYRTREGRARLLEGTYPCAWGNDELKLDAFLTGTVVLPTDLREATVIIKAFDRAHLEPQEVLRLNVPVSLALLSDMDLSFYVRSRGSDDDALGIPELVKDAAESAQAVEVAKQKAAAAPQPVAVRPAPAVQEPVEQALDFRVLYNGKEVQRGKNGELATPGEGVNVEFRLKNRSPRRIGVVVRVNGVNTVDNDNDDKDPRFYRRWILDPGKEYALSGFYKDNSMRSKFTGIAPEKVRQQPELFVTSKLGKIDIDVFREGKLRQESADEGQNAEKQQDPRQFKYNLSEPSRPAATLALLRGQVKSTQDRQVDLAGLTDRSLIGPGEVEKENVRQVEFQGYHVGHLTISYFSPAAPPKETGPTTPPASAPK